MQDIIRRRNIKLRKNRIRKKRIRVGIFIIILIISSMAIISKFKTLHNAKNNNVTSVNKVNQSKVSVGSDKSIDEPVKSGENTTKESNSVKNISPDTEANNTNSSQAVTQEKNEGINESVNAEQALVNDGKKIAYLTFDDGPSTTVTPQILDVLKQYNIKGTFFVLGSNVERNEGSKEMIKRTFKEGNAIGNHSYTHSLSKLYPHNRVNVNYFMQEVDKTNNALKGILGQDFNTRIIRMPGGYISRQYYKDPNLPAFDAKLKEKNLCSVDWNAFNADAEGKWKNASQLLDEVKSTTTGKEKVIILMHDTYGKEETAKALPQIIEYLKSQGYEFKTLK
ncbi:polysaccharide deacetylase family protein [Clostridium sp. OS1-26]|uniref:polysaccharide deacetylase family protein n=1 Tax=Clostridium sp. OS1-26 TaxID=3070681 RepID=UPI0027E042C2|nr:polysaccharide deacetylase family protein [Clostridium sp. OS1-26]WML34960.1 polysaccharide deacetylase family protein [Clostridium sp. OS1-26]